MKTDVKPLITEEERARRREAVEFARASVALEGFTFDSNEVAHERRFIDGEISLEEYVTEGLPENGG